MNDPSPPSPPVSSKTPLSVLRNRDSFLILIPGLLACALAAVIVYGLMLPSFAQSLTERRKENTREMVSLALKMLDHFAASETNGELSRDAAQAEALTFLRAYRHGPDNRGYFWVNDMQPAMLMHPHRQDLVGQNLDQYRDADGRFVFRNFVETVREQGAGFVSYRWQFPGAQEGEELPKLSYVAQFARWGWVVGTGVYEADLRQEVARVTRQADRYGLGMLALVILLSAFLSVSGIRHANRRRLAEAALRTHQEKLEELVRNRTADLQKALDEVKTLRGLLPICMHCKKIRDDEGAWTLLESYIHRHSEATFSHGICPDCLQKHYSEVLAKKR